MKKLLIKWGFEALSQLIENSLKSNVLEIVKVVLAFIASLIEILTDDNKDNTEQIKELIKRDYPSVKETLDSLVDSL